MRGISLFAIGLTILFIGLKLTNQIDWSWWLVLAPALVVYGVPMFFVGAVLAFIFFAFLAAFLFGTVEVTRK